MATRKVAQELAIFVVAQAHGAASTFPSFIRLHFCEAQQG
eukprot:CAMPEP_0170582322 /NCGR_PEP_ID=MMETSP0224-20130122/7520_1 /TAXON_ID=285029 /ORGANISM="Togula jolla, Strain CCCM 725" /LENGTH=39 /DNA_ID= /DNA_START= /DNA_END= /DNA_ORIENTATION=